MSPLLSKLRSTARRVLKGPPPPPDGHQYHGAFRGNLDGLSDEGVIRGWVIHRESKKGRVPVGLYAGTTLLDARIADELREDVRVATGGEATCGFQFGLTETHYQKIAEAGGALRLRPEGPEAVGLGRLQLAVEEDTPGVGADLRARCRFALKRELATMHALLEGTPAAEALPTAPEPRPALDRHRNLFTTDRYVGGGDRRQRAEQPEGDRGQLIVGIGKHLQQRGGRPRQRTDDNPRQHQRQHPVSAAHGRGNRHDQRDGEQPSGKGRKLDERDRQRQEDPRHRPQPSPC